MPTNTAAKKPTTAAKSNATIDISVIIASFNSSETIGKALTAILNQQTHHTYEVIVVDSSNDDTADYIRREFPQVRVLKLQRQTYPGTARNYGIQVARGKHVVFTDSDCLPKSDWLDQILQTFSKVDAEAVGGCLINGFPRSITAWVSHLIEFNEWTETTPEGFVKNIPSANLAYETEAFDRYGEYFPDYLGSEDTILNSRMRMKGVKIYFNPRIRLIHLNRVGFKKLFRHQFMLGRWSSEARRKGLLPGGFLAKSPVFAFLIPFMRLGMALQRLVRKDIPKFLILLGVSPLYLAAAFSWSLGFVSHRRLQYSEEPQFELTVTEDSGTNS